MHLHRRTLLTATAAMAFARPALAARPASAELTPALIDAAKKEGKIA